MIRAHPGWAWLTAALFAAAALFCVPLGIESHALLGIGDDPAAIADHGLSEAFNRDVAIRETESALQGGDADLAGSFASLAADRGILLPPELLRRVAEATAQANSTKAAVNSFASGLITGEPKDMAGLTGTAVGDLFVFGDIRDAVREGRRYATGESYDQLVLGLACLGIAVTAGTYVTAGAAVPARAGLTAVKAARKVGRLSGSLAGWIGRSLRELIDWSALSRARAALAEPVVAVRAVREAVKVEKAEGLVRLAGDVGKVQAKAGTRAALDGLRIADGPRDVSRIAVLAEKKGNKTRAILKLLGRGAILLSVASLDLTLWVFGAIMTLFGLVSSIKSAVERATWRHLQRRRERRLSDGADVLVLARA